MDDIVNKNSQEKLLLVVTCVIISVLYHERIMRSANIAMFDASPEMIRGKAILNNDFVSGSGRETFCMVKNESI